MSLQRKFIENKCFAIFLEFSSIIYFQFGGHTGSAQRLLMVPYSEITPGRVQETICNANGRTWYVTYKANHPAGCTFFLQPQDVLLLYSNFVRQNRIVPGIKSPLSKFPCMEASYSSPSYFLCHQVMIKSIPSTRSMSHDK